MNFRSNILHVRLKMHQGVVNVKRSMISILTCIHDFNSRILKGNIPAMGILQKLVHSGSCSICGNKRLLQEEQGAQVLTGQRLLC
jgi:hypothetical protein